MITEPSLVGDIDKRNDLTLFSHDKNVMTRPLHLANNNKTITNCMDNLTIGPKEKLDFPKRKNRNLSY